jgi:hypothetical protein
MKQVQQMIAEAQRDKDIQIAKILQSQQQQ